MIKKNYRRAVDLFAVPFLTETALYWGRIDEQKEESSDGFLSGTFRIYGVLYMANKCLRARFSGEQNRCGYRLLRD